MSHTLSLEYPESLSDALHMTRAEFEQTARLAMAAKLFETGKLTSGQAVRLIGMARVAFLGEPGRLGVSAIQNRQRTPSASWRGFCRSGKPALAVLGGGKTPGTRSNSEIL